ncbi:MAG: hypothetical protein OEW17_03820 [Gemmatimonadota bacterium]|nr:hypothetical protein [Gemmatimonadota bacterium]MDH5254594.1 hypothetical protein [Gammaproteobacteria bacterium]
MPSSGVRLRLFLTCWILYSLHFATDFVREHYLVLGIVEHQSYALDDYYGLHVDIFQNPPNAPVQGAHHGANPGISMVAAMPYALFRPAVDWVVNRELASRADRADTAVVYRDDRPRRVEFYHRIRERGLDIRFALVSAITQTFCMAPLSAASVVLLFSLLAHLGLGTRTSLGMSLLYAFGTPVFFRTGYLNQNLAIGLFSLAAFVLLWNPNGFSAWSPRRRHLIAGALGGLSFLCDYSGAIPMGLLGLYAWWKQTEERGPGDGFRLAVWYAAGCLPGMLLLAQYQYASFGNPFYPPQHWMAPVEWIDVGYQGVGGLSTELVWLLLADPRYGLLLTMPMTLLALAAPWFARTEGSPVPLREALVCLVLSASLVLFFGTVQYTRLQWVTGIRYLAAVLPFIFLAAVPVLLRLPRAVVWAIGMLSVTIAWSMSMVRSQGTVFDNIQQVFIEGFQLPWLTVLGKLSAQYAPWLKHGVSPLPLFLLTGALVWLVWKLERPGNRLDRTR